MYRITLLEALTLVLLAAIRQTCGQTLFCQNILRGNSSKFTTSNFPDIMGYHLSQNSKIDLFINIDDIY